MIEKVRENKVMKKVLEFIESDKFIFFATFLTILSNAFSLEFFAWGVAFTVGVITILFSKDLRAVLPITLLACFCVSRVNNTKGVSSMVYVKPEDRYFLLEDPKGYITVAVLGGILAVLLLIRLFVLKDIKKIIAKKHNFKFAILSLSLAVLTGGLTIKYFSFFNLKQAVILMISYSVMYFLLLGTIDFKNIDFSYFAKFFASFTLIASFAVLVVIIGYSEEVFTVMDGVKMLARGTLGTGWGAPNTIGLLYCLGLPFLYYLAIKGKNGYLYIIYTIITYLITALTLSRMTILFGAVIILTGFIILLIKGKERLKNLITIGVIFITIVVLGIIFFDKIADLITKLIDAGFNLSGRKELLKKGFELFKKSPILGVGYAGIDISNGFNLYGSFHNIIMEIMVTSGIVGLILLIYHFVLVFLRLIKYKTEGSLTILFAILILIAFSLVDRFFFVPALAIFYSVFLTLGDAYGKKEE